MAAAQPARATIFERRFTRGTAKPVVESATLSIKNFQAPFTLRMVNGPDGRPRVSSASVWVNGQLLFKPSDFSKNFSGKSLAVSLTDPSTVQVELKSEPGSALDIRIDGAPAPQPLQVTYDEAWKVSRSIDPAIGGWLELPGSNGQAYTLDIPPGALWSADPQTVTMTRIAGIDNLPAPLRFLAGVRLEPHGSFFLKPVRLQVFIPNLAASTGLSAVYRGDSTRGYRFHPIQSIDRAASTVTIWLSGFSDVGVITDQILANCNLQGSCLSSQAACEPYEYYQQAAACVMQPVVDCQLLGIADCDVVSAELLTVLKAWYEELVMPGIYPATTQDDFVKAIQELERWETQLQTLALQDDDPFVGMLYNAKSVLSQRLCGRVEALDAQCIASTDACAKDGMLREGLSWAAFAQSVGDGGFSLTCAHYDFCRGWVSTGVGSLEITTPPPTLRQGDSVQLDLRMKNHQNQEISKPVSWATGNPSVADVDQTGRVTALGVGTAVVSAKADCPVATVGVTVTAEPAIVITLPPTGAQLYVGECTSFSVPQAVPSLRLSVDPPILWCGTSPGGFTCRADAEGQATITVVDGTGASAAITLNVGPKLRSIVLTPATQTLYLPADMPVSEHRIDASEVFSGRGCRVFGSNLDPNGQGCAAWWCGWVDWASATWSTSDPDVVATSAGSTRALLMARGPGTAVISLTLHGVTGTAVVVVKEGATGIDVRPRPAFIAAGGLAQLAAIGRDRNGQEVAGCSFTWQGSPTSDAVSVDRSGLVTGLRRGRSTVHAYPADQCPPGNPHLPHWGSSEVFVVPATASASATLSMQVWPATIAVGSPSIVTPTWTDAAGNIIDGPTMDSLVSLTPVVANFDPLSNLLRGLAPGIATVEGTKFVGYLDNERKYVSARGQVAVVGVVPPQPASMTVSPRTAEAGVGTTVQLGAAVRDTNGQEIAGAVVTWTTSNPAVASVSASGVVTGVSAGTAVITATSGLLQDSATVTVTMAPVVPAPEISSFTGSATTINAGESTSLSATFTGGTGVITPGDIPISSGASVTVTPATTTTYTLTVTPAAGSPVTSAVTITVGAASAPAWTRTGDMGVGRSNHTATLLQDGRVLIVGGSPATAEIYNPAAGVFTSAASNPTMHGPFATATRLLNGQVLIVGGASAERTAELFNPQTNTFSAAGPLNEGRHAHTATLLKGGRVLVTGGQQSVSGTQQSLASSEIYDPDTNTFQATGPLSQDRSLHGAALLADGRVLVAGGYKTTTPGNGVRLASAEIYNPASGKFSLTTGIMSEARDDLWYVGMPVLANGKVLVVSGFSASSAEVFDPVTGTFSPAGTTTSARIAPTATLLRNGSVLIAGGAADAPQGSFVTLATAELYDPATGTFTPTATMHAARQQHTAMLLDNGQILVTGGVTLADGTDMQAAELYTMGTVTPSTEAVIESVKPSTVADGFGQLLTIIGKNLPASATTRAEFTQGATKVDGFVFQYTGDATQRWVRLPVDGDSPPGTPLLQTGPASVRLIDGTIETNSASLIVSTTPGTPEIRFLVNLFQDCTSWAGHCLWTFTRPMTPGPWRSRVARGSWCRHSGSIPP